jgi:hypothetical protein
VPGLNDYEFESIWHLNASPDECYAVLYDLARYPDWWPEVKEAHRLNESSFELLCRSLLPYDLKFVTERSVEDPEARVLEAKMRGDLEGFSRWTIEPSSAGAACTFHEHVVTNKSLLNKLAAVARPAFRANHTLMMRNGYKGLRTFISGYQAGREPSA